MHPKLSRRSLLRDLLVGCIGAAGLREARAGEAASATAEAFVADLARRIVVALRDPAHGEAQRLEEVDRVARGSFDLDRTARIALGRYWKPASPEQRSAFVTLFKDHVLISYGRRFHDYADRSFRVTGARPSGDDVTVESLVEGGATPIRLDWRVGRTNHGWRVLDVAVEGVSLLLTYRNEFAAVIERQGGQVEGLLDELRRRVASERARLAT
ncbi:MAG: phospholipid-binding protein MlaC [Geminicoccaceae bacterium]